MIALNLTANTTEQTILKDYFESNVSETLAEKINNGVCIEKEGKTFLSKKDLMTFLSYACDEAKKQAEKGARFACVNDKTVFDWAIHYFEENSIEGTLYNEDGTEYKPKPVVKQNNFKPAAAAPLVEKPKPQMSLFDMLNTSPAEPAEIKQEVFEQKDNCETVGELPDKTCETEQDTPEKLVKVSENKYVDEDGVIHETKPTNNSIPSVLQKIFGDMLIER